MPTIDIPLYRPSLKGNEKAYVMECLDTSWISWRGRFVGAFEQQFAARLGDTQAVAVCNGSAALHLALVALGIGPGDEVILPTFTYVSCAHSVAHAGATPVFVDSLRQTWQMDPDAIARAITPRTKAIMVVHLYGHPCDMDPILRLKEQHGFYLIEDCAEAFGASYRGRPVATIGDIATFSFFANKTITTGEGGMVVGADRLLMEKCRRLRTQGLVPGSEYEHDMIGFNYRMTNVTAAIGLAQLERADELIRRKRALAEAYFRRCADLPLEFHRESPGSIHAYWMISALARSRNERDALRSHLAAAGVETRPLLPPIHTMPIYPDPFGRRTIADDLAARGLNLPSWPDLSEAELERICAAAEKFYANA